MTHRGEGSVSYHPTNPTPSETPIPMSPEPMSGAAAQAGDDEEYEVVRPPILTPDEMLDSLLLQQKERQDKKAANEAGDRIYGT